mmetsp:Transcript_27537/g.56260  ORF Transcript_27537/g.56260 Transcript_27537/m.56260 type:complete len:587 (+) Transcript_27537:63-1823(+)
MKLCSLCLLTLLIFFFFFIEVNGFCKLSLSAKSCSDYVRLLMLPHQPNPCPVQGHSFDDVMSAPHDVTASKTYTKGIEAPSNSKMRLVPPSSESMPLSLPLFSSCSKFSSHNRGLARRRRWLVVDFDGTCTEHDTTPLLPKLAALAHRSRSSILSTESQTQLPTNEMGESVGLDSSVKNTEIASLDSQTSKMFADGEEYNHEQDLERRLSLFQELENEFLKRYGEAKSVLFKLFEDHKNDCLKENKSCGGSDGELSMKSSIDGGKTKGQLPPIHDVLHALDEPSNVVTEMVSESRVLHGLGHADSSELEEMLHLHGIAPSEAELERVMGGVNSFGEHKSGEVTSENVDKVVVRLRHGCEGTLARLLAENMNDGLNEGEAPSCLGWSLAVLSINWCPALIDASLVKPVLRKRQHLLRTEKRRNEAIPPVENLQLEYDAEIPIWSNHVDGDGVVTLHVPGSLAKRDRIAELRRRLHEEFESEAETNSQCALATSSGRRSIIVYVGDSSTDLAALLEADIGIIMGKSSSTVLIAERWGIQISPLQKRDRSKFRDVIVCGEKNRDQKIIWQVESWQEIDEMIRELDDYWE